MKKGRLYNRQEIELIAKSAIGKSVNDILNEEVVTIEDKNSNNKGEIGQLIEQYLYGIENNNSSEPDFMPAGIELKVTPYKKLKNGQLSAKERLVLNVIDYKTEYKNTFESSHFLFKNNTLQILWYLWNPNKNRKDMKITHEKLFKLTTSGDIKQIKKDWECIINKIREGKAHEISEADTMYLAATTKGASSKDKRKQPVGDILAKQRAFSLKGSYMTQLVRKYIGNYADVEKVIKDKEYTLDEYIYKVVEKFKNKSRKQLFKEFGIKTTAKNVNNILINRMFNVKSKLKDTDEFSKANIIPKTLTVESNGLIKESMSFPYFKYDDILKKNFDESDLKEELETTKYLFFVFEHKNNEYYFKGIKLWNMPEDIIESKVKSMYEKTQEVIRTGTIVSHINKKGQRFTNFPGIRDNGICHVRPHGKNASDVIPLPVADKLTGVKEYTKHCFWFNSGYIKEIISDML